MIERATTGQIIPKEKKGYNQRLFNKGWRKYLHESRYLWLRKKMIELNLQQPSILELGCFDAKTLDYLPFGFSGYTGYDANWENGLSAGKERWKNDPSVVLIESHDTATFNPLNQQFDCTIALETLEHLALDELDEYILKLKAATRQFLFVSVPYEKGLPFMIKYMYKTVLFKRDEPYSLNEFLHAAAGDLSKVSRVERGHKGFDYRQLLVKLAQSFNIIAVEGLPFSTLPVHLNFSVGILAVAKKE